MTTTPSASLKSLRAYVLEHGWTQGTLWQPDGSVCAMGGLYKSGRNTKEVMEYLCRAMDEVKVQAMPSPCRAIGFYNDYGIESIDEFIEWVDAAIALAEADEASEQARDEARELVTA